MSERSAAAAAATTNGSCAIMAATPVRSGVWHLVHLDGLQLYLNTHTQQVSLELPPPPSTVAAHQHRPHIRGIHSVLMTEESTGTQSDSNGDANIDMGIRHSRPFSINHRLQSVDHSRPHQNARTTTTSTSTSPSTPTPTTATTPATATTTTATTATTASIAPIREQSLSAATTVFAPRQPSIYQQPTPARVTPPTSTMTQEVTQSGSKSGRLRGLLRNVFKPSRFLTQRKRTNTTTTTTTTTTTIATSVAHSVSFDSAMDVYSDGIPPPPVLSEVNVAALMVKRDSLHANRAMKIQPHLETLMILRNDILEYSFNAILDSTPDRLKSTIRIQFLHEPGIDGSGLSREWYHLLSLTLFDPGYGLFRYENESNASIHINPDSGILSDHHLKYFKLAGRFIAMALFHKQTLSIHLSQMLVRSLLERPITFDDLKTLLPDAYDTLQSIRRYNLDDIGVELTFSIDSIVVGTTNTVDLIPNGQSIPVDDNNKEDYLQKATEYYSYNSIKDQLDAMRSGFKEIVPSHLLAEFTDAELIYILCGSNSIDVDDWKANTNYLGGYRPEDKIIQWFWDIVSKWDDSKKTQLLIFTTGTQRLPAGGFKNLLCQSGYSKFNIESDFDIGNTGKLPTSHTCANLLHLPNYPDRKTLEKKLEMAIQGSNDYGYS